MSNAGSGFTRDLADWASRRDFQWSSTAHSGVRDAFVDVLACMIAGSAEPVTRTAYEIAERSDGDSVYVVGSGLQASPTWAAFVGGTAAHALDFDDNFLPALSHATAVLAPALFVLAQQIHAPGERIVDAYIVGLELQARIGRLLNPWHYEAGWHATATIASVGSAGACASLLGLGPGGVQAAISIACSMASGSKKQFGSMMKPIHAGLAARNAVLAARMAQAGISGDPEPLCGPWGLADLYGGGWERTPSEALCLDDLGATLAIETHGLLAKRFPCCGAAHKTLDGIEALRAQYGIAAKAVARLETVLPDLARRNLRFDQPQDEMEARFSLTYCAARMLETGRLVLSDLTPARVAEPEIRALFGRISIVTTGSDVSSAPNLETVPVLTRILMADGNIHEISIIDVKGSNANPLSEAERFDKFAECCRWASSGAAAPGLYDAASSIPDAADFSHIAQTMVDQHAA